MKILVTGGSGRLASELIKVDKDLILVSSKDFDIRDEQQVTDFLSRELDIDIIIHAAAMTNPMGDHEKDPASSIMSNIVGTGIMAACARRIIPNAKFVYISTDYVYDGTGNHVETDYPSPTTNYGKSKLGGEVAVSMLPEDKYLIIRASMTPYPFKHESAYSDAIKNPLWMEHAAHVILKLIKLDANGIYNLGANWTTSIYNFARKAKGNVKPISRLTADYPVPADTSLNVDKLNKFIK